ARALLAFAEGLLRLEDLGSLQAPYLERDLLERGGGHGEHRRELGVAVALDDLRRDGRGLETKLAAPLGFDVGLDVGEVPDGARELADRDRRARAPQAFNIAAGFGVPDRDLEAEARRLGVDAVGAADRQGVLVAAREDAERFLEPLLSGDQ